MNQDHLRALWTAVGLVLGTYTLAAWVAGQGGAFQNTLLIVQGKVPGAVVAYAVCAAMLIVVLLAGRLYARRATADHGATAWHERVPVVSSDLLPMRGLDTGSPEGRVYQGFFLALFVLLPVAGLAHFAHQIVDAEVFDGRGELTELTVFSVPPSERVWGALGGDASFWIAENAVHYADKARVTWFPVVQPLAMGLLGLWAAALALSYAAALFDSGGPWRRHRRRVSRAAPAAAPGAAANGPEC
ncbi:MAG: hypothetical protein AAF677_11420 [Pseudomonadota bacterium]